jgi:hypothetical protein
MAHHVTWCNQRDGGSGLFFGWEKKEMSTKFGWKKIIEKRPVKIRRNTRTDNAKYDKNSNMLGGDAVQISKKLLKT